MTFAARFYRSFGTTAPAVDPYAANVVSLMRFEGSSITDDIGDNIWTASGATQTSTGALTGSKSLSITSATQYVKTTTNPTRFQFGTGDFTVEFTGKFGTQTATYPVPIELVNDDGSYQFGDTTWQFYFQGSNPLLSWWKDGAIDLTGDAFGAFDGTTVRRFAVSRVSGVTSIYMDGVRIATQSDTTNYSGGNTLIIGNGGDYGNATLGLIDEVRITKGVGRYSGASYTVSTDPFPDVGWTPGLPSGPYDSGWLSPGSVRTAAYGMGITWSNINNVMSSDNARATSTSTSGTISDLLIAYNFGLSLPAGTVINGIQVRIEASGGSGVAYLGQLVFNASTLSVGGSFQSSPTNFSSTASGTESYTSFGGTNDVASYWGGVDTDGDGVSNRALVLSDVNKSDFGFYVANAAFIGSPGLLSVDHMQVRIYATIP